MIGRITLLTSLALAFAASACGDETRLRFRKEIVRGENPGDEILSVPLDDNVYAASRDGFPDLRIIDDRGAEVPYVVETIGRPRLIDGRATCASKTVSLQVEEKKALEVVIALDQDSSSADGATIRTPLFDFERRVRVYGSRELEGDDWTLLTDGSRIFDYSRFMDVRNLDVALPSNHFRRYKFVIEQEDDERESPFRELIRKGKEGRPDPAKEVEITSIFRRPFRIDRIDLWRKTTSEGGVEETIFSYPASAVRIETVAPDQLTRIEIRSGRQPLTGLRPVTGSRNFSRTARVLVTRDRPGREEWVEIGQGTISRFALQDFRREETTITFPERRAERYRIEIENADNPPLDVTSIEGEGKGHRLVFLAESARSYRLFYGSDTLEAPRYDAAAVIAAIGPKSTPVDSTLGQEIPNAAYRERDDRPTPLNARLFLMAAILVMIVVLAWALIGAGQRLKKFQTDDRLD